MGIAGIVFLAIFTLDALLSTVDEAVRALSSLAFGPTRELTADVAIVGAIVGAVCCAVSPRWPARVYLPPILATFWLAGGALPLPLWVESDELMPLLCAVQLGFAAISWAMLRTVLRRSGGLRGLSAARAPWSPWRLAGFASASLLAAPFVAVGYLAFATAYWTELATDGFVDVRADGVALTDRRYVRDAQEVRLVGMVHIGESGSYDALFDSFNGESTLVLEEGVTDREGRLANPLSYAGAARALGLAQQGSIAQHVADARSAAAPEEDPPSFPDVRLADIDVSEMSPTTVAMLDRVAGVWSAPDPTTALFALMRRPPPEDEMALAMHELVDLRNERVIDEVERGLASHLRVVVPWGALHLPGIAQAVESEGFVLAEEHQRLLVSWRTVLSALLR